MEVQKDDIVILSSDGLWDVIRQDQLQAIMERNTPEVMIDFQEKMNSFSFFSIYKI